MLFFLHIKQDSCLGTPDMQGGEGGVLMDLNPSNEIKNDG